MLEMTLQQQHHHHRIRISST